MKIVLAWRLVMLLLLLLSACGQRIAGPSKTPTPLLVSLPTATSSPCPVAFPPSSNDLQQLKATTDNGFINECQAVELANIYCARTHSPPEEQPLLAQANLMSRQEAQKIHQEEHNDDYPPGTKVWVVILEGKWQHWGPPPAEGTPHVPITFKRCRVFIDAASGEMWALTN